MRKRITSMMMVVLMAGLFFANAALAYDIVQIKSRISATAGENLTLGQAVCIKDADGYAYKADANDAALRPAVGIVGKTTASGALVEIVTEGILSGWTTLSEGQYGYLSETAAAVTQSAPAYAQILGVAISSTTFYFRPSSYLDTSAVTALGVLAGATPIILEGATANDFETTIAVTDPTADRTFTLPDVSGVPILSSAIPGAAGSISGSANTITFEGATANDFETIITVTDPTADTTVTIPDGATGALMVSTLATNAPDVANSVTGASNGIVFEGATANAHETTISATDPTADRSVVLPDAGGTVMLSTLATNAPDAANSVTGASNGLVFEGATANAHETTLTVTDPTADRTVTMPDASGTVTLNATATHDYGAAAVDWTLSTNEAQASYITVSNANGAVNAILSAAIPGKTYTVYNNSGQILTFKVTGQAGGTIADGKWAFYTTLAADVVEVYELP